MNETAKKAALATLVVGGIVVLALALWQLRALGALLFLAFILAAAMRPTVEALARRGLPRAFGIGLHYLVLIGMIVGFLWAVVPRAIDQVDSAIGDLPQTRSDLGDRGGTSRPGSGTTSSSGSSAGSRTCPRASGWSTPPSR